MEGTRTPLARLIASRAAWQGMSMSALAGHVDRHRSSGARWAQDGLPGGATPDLATIRLIEPVLEVPSGLLVQAHADPVHAFQPYAPAAMLAHVEGTAIDAERMVLPRPTGGIGRTTLDELVGLWVRTYASA